MALPNIRQGYDWIAWNLSTNGKFSMNSAYARLCIKENEELNFNWKKVWKVQGPHKMKTFPWLVYHESILTNQFQMRRSLIADASCP